MHKGLNRTTLGVLGAALLSSSVYAAGPTLKNLPTVIITDRHEISKQQSGIEFDFETATTQNRYRFTIAFDLADCVTYKSNTPSELDEVHYLFTEFDETDTTPQSTISINGEIAYSGTPAHADIVNTANDVGTVGTGGVLDFINEVRSPGGASGADPGGNFTDNALLHLYVASDDPSTGTDVDMKSFNVITTNDTGVATGDTLEESGVWSPVLCVEAFDDWYKALSFEGLPDFSTIPATFPAITSGVAVSSTTSTTNGGSGFAGRSLDFVDAPGTTLNFTTAEGTGNTSGYAPHYWGWSSWARDFDSVKTTAPVTKGNLYMVRWTLSGDATTTQADSKGLGELRFRVGEPTSLGIGQTYDSLTAGCANGITGNSLQQHRTYFYAMDDGEIGFNWDVFNLYDTSGAVSSPATASLFTLDKVEVFSLDPSTDLQGASVEMNHGGAGPLGVASDGLSVEPPSTGRVDFDEDTDGTGASDSGDWIARDNPILVDRLTLSVTASQMSFVMTAGDGSFLGSFDTFGTYYNDPDYPAAWPATTSTVSSVDNSKLIRLDVWMSSPDGSTPDNLLPVGRIGIQTGSWGESADISSTPFVNQGRASYHVFEGHNRDRFDVGASVPAVLDLQTAPRQYTVFMEPMVRATGASTVDVHPTIDFYAFAADTTANNSDPNTNEANRAGTVHVHRVVMTTYDSPSDTTSADACP